MMTIECTRAELPSLVRDLAAQGLAFRVHQSGCDGWTNEITGY